jgi:hypothetical protein
MPLRGNFEPGTSRWATRRAQWRALGLTDEDMVKPKIAIVNSSSQLAICSVSGSINSVKQSPRPNSSAAGMRCGRRPAPKSGAGSPSTSAWSVPSRRAPCCESQPHDPRASRNPS